MQLRMRVLGTLLLGALSWAGVAVADTATVGTSAHRPSAAAMAATCAACHGPNGVSEGPAIPTIAGLSPQYFVKSMDEYRDGTRPATVMGYIAKGYSDDEIGAMAAWFARQRFIGHSQPVDPELAHLGGRIHATYCFKCHADNGRATLDHAGVLAGQWAPYLRSALLDSSRNKRPMPRAMRVRLQHLYEAFGQRGIDAMADFYSSQKNPD